MAHLPGPESLPSSWTSESSGRILSLLVPRASFACSSSNFLARRNCSFSVNVWGATWKRKTKGQTQMHGSPVGGSLPSGPLGAQSSSQITYSLGPRKNPQLNHQGPMEPSSRMSPVSTTASHLSLFTVSSGLWTF